MNEVLDEGLLEVLDHLEKTGYYNIVRTPENAHLELIEAIASKVPKTRLEVDETLFDYTFLVGARRPEGVKLKYPSEANKAEAQGLRVTKAGITGGEVVYRIILSEYDDISSINVAVWHGHNNKGEFLLDSFGQETIQHLTGLGGEHVALTYETKDADNNGVCPRLRFVHNNPQDVLDIEAHDNYWKVERYNVEDLVNLYSNIENVIVSENGTFEHRGQTYHLSSSV
jgi:hypothetical protein